MELLAREIADFINSHKDGNDWKVVMCAGTGVSSLYLAKALHDVMPKDAAVVTVVAVSCVMQATALLQSLKHFVAEFNVKQPIFPYILDSPKSCRFAEPSLQLLEVWNELGTQTGITFDLLYAPPAWLKLSQDFMLNSEFWDNSSVIYIHCGGTEGNDSQLNRYSYLKTTKRLKKMKTHACIFS